jgi:putative spermidine/putrescine transport system substrate-binding protein
MFVKRRDVLALGTMAALLPFGIRASHGQAMAKEIRMMTWGGSWLDIFRPVAQAFEKDTGTRVEFVVQSGSGDGLNKIKAQRANPQIDVWTSIASTVEAATKDDLLARLDPAKIPQIARMPREFVKPTGVSIWLSPRGIFYRKDLVPFEPKTWEDLWDPRLKDKVGVTLALDRGSFLIVAALLNGGNEHKIDAGFEKVKSLKPNIHAVYTTDPESIKLLETGEVGVVAWGALPNVYRHLGPDSKYAFVMPKPRFLADIPVSIVKGRGAAEQAAAEKFVDYMLRPEYQTIMASIAGTVPANPAAQIPDKLKSIVPSLPITDVYSVDWPYVNSQFSMWEDRWAREVQMRQ